MTANKMPNKPMFKPTAKLVTEKPAAKKPAAKKVLFQKKAPEHKATVQPIIEHEQAQNKGFNNNPVPEMLEDIHDMIENVAHMSTDFVKTITDSMNLTMNLMSNIISGASECAGEMMNRNSGMAEKCTKCSNAHDVLNLHHGFFDNNYGLFNHFGINCGDHVNSFTKGFSEIMDYNLKNNWLEKLKNKKKVK